MSAPAPPVATFSVVSSSPTAGAQAPLQRRRIDRPGVGVSIVSYTWDFGDGDGHDEYQPERDEAYAAPGNYPVTLTILDSARANRDRYGFE